MGKGFLIDTNVIIDFSEGRFGRLQMEHIEKVLNNTPNISVINKMELLGFSNVPQTLVEFIAFTRILPIDDAVVEKTIFIRKQRRIKLPDAIIGATALVHDLTLLTSNVADFGNLPDLQICHPSSLV